MPNHAHNVTGFDPTSSVGGGQSHTNIKPFQAINFEIALQGLFPTRNAGTGGISPNSSEPLLGFVHMSGYGFTQRGYAQTNGQLLPIAQNQALYSVLGTTYGGDGRTTFGLPDLRGRLTAHEGQGPTDFRSLGQKDGVENVTLNTNQLPIHTHPPDPGVIETIEHTGGGQSHENTKPTNTLNYVIAVQGVFPSRNADTGDIEQNNSDPFLGEIAMFAGNFAPIGWEFADGQILNIADNPALFSILGTTYGGDGRQTFGLPDLRGRVPVHVGGTSGTGPGLRTWTWGEEFGLETHTLTEGEMPAHSHTYIPEPGSAALCLLGSAAMLVRRRRSV